MREVKVDREGVWWIGRGDERRGMRCVGGNEMVMVMVDEGDEDKG